MKIFLEDKKGLNHFSYKEEGDSKMPEKQEVKAGQETPIRLLEEQIADELKIDEAQLQKELKNQPSRFFQWARLWAKASIVKKMSWLRLKETEATVSKEFRCRMAEEESKPRVTEKTINEFLTSDPSYIEAREAYFKAEYKINILAAAKDAFQQRHQSIIEMYKDQSEENN
jgi:hypothetical protein